MTQLQDDNEIVLGNIFWLTVLLSPWKKCVQAFTIICGSVNADT